MNTKLYKIKRLVCLLLLMSMTSHAARFRLGWPGNLVAGVDFAYDDYPSLEAAANANDTVQVYQQNFPNGSSYTITKPLRFLGYGYLLNRNTGLQIITRSDSGYNAPVSFYFQTGSDGSSIEGLSVTHISIAEVSNISIKKCRINDDIDLDNVGTISNITVMGCFTSSYWFGLPNVGFNILSNNFGPVTNLKIVNNYMGGIYLGGGTTGTIANNVFAITSYGFSKVHCNVNNFSTSNVLIKNNIVVNDTYGDCYLDPTGNTGVIKNNLFAYTQGFCPAVTGNGNVYGVNMNAVFSNFNGGNIYTDGQLALATGSPAINAGKNNANANTNCGIYGGETAEVYKLSGIPEIPSIYSLNFSVLTPQTSWAGTISTRSNTTSNITRVEYYIDNDPGYGLATNVTITASTNIVNAAVNVATATISALTPGLHRLVIRSRDAAGRWSLNNSKFFVRAFAVPSNPAVTNITRLEYFVDSDPGYGLATNLTISAATNIVNQTIAINPATLSAGLHRLNVRAKSANGAWSLMNSLLVYKPYTLSSTATPPPNLTKLEYYFDTDPGEGLATNVPIASTTDIANLVIPINPSILSEGIHRFNVRTKDANGSWSLMNTMLVYKPYATSGSVANAPNLTQLEYYFDNDPGEGLASNVPITSTTNIANLVIPINPSILTEGIHRFNVRAKDANGSWSLKNSMLVYKPYSSSETIVQAPELTKLEYFIDTDPGEGLATEVTIPTGTQLNNFIAPIDVYSLCNGPHRIIVRAKDANGAWSLLNQMDFVKGSTNFTVVNIKAFMEGYYTSNAHMKPVLFNEGVSNLSSLTDSVEIELHNASYPFALAHTFKGVLDVIGQVACEFPLSINQQSYYIAIKHRNSIETWSANPILIDACTVYDFTSSSAQAYGSNQKQMESNTFAIYTGDIDQDRVIELSDYSIWETDANNFEAGYRNTDLNGDGAVDISDYSFWEANANNFIGAITP